MLLESQKSDLQTLMNLRVTAAIPSEKRISITNLVRGILAKNSDKIVVLLEWCDTNHTGFDILEEQLRLIFSLEVLNALYEKATLGFYAEELIRKRIFQLMP